GRTRRRPSRRRPGPPRRTKGRRGRPTARVAAGAGGRCRPGRWPAGVQGAWSWQSSGARGALAHHELVVDKDGAGLVAGLGVVLERERERRLGDRPLVGRDGREAGRAEPPLLDVVDPDDRDVVRGL